MSAARWQRLADDLAALDITIRVDEKSYSEDRRGRAYHGVSRSGFLRLPDGRCVEILDKWWSKNPDVWIGWQVFVSGTDDLVDRIYPLTKKRTEVVAAVEDTLKAAAA